MSPYRITKSRRSTNCASARWPAQRAPAARSLRNRTRPPQFYNQTAMAQRARGILVQKSQGPTRGEKERETRRQSQVREGMLRRGEKAAWTMWGELKG